jgi:murein DD-endopeptidase MepM/ murein hydrolase activator NlpD
MGGDREWRWHWLLALLLWPCVAGSLAGEEIRFPTENRALLNGGGGDRFFVGTVGKPWTSGTFGCVRSDGWQVHEGIDIRALQRDRRGEATDPVMACADGTVAYVNRRAGLSNYGLYLIIQHRLDGLEVYSLYAHLREIRADLKPGQTVRGGETIGVLGRTANTREGISKERAHVHFELNLFVNERFNTWYKSRFPKQRNDHGIWNGQNLLAFDPAEVLLRSHQTNGKFSLLEFIRSQRPLCRVLVRKTQFPWLQRYPALIRPNPLAAAEGIAGYELALNFNGIPFELTPRAASEIKSKAAVQLLWVDPAEYQKNPGRRLVTKKGAQWQLTPQGERLLDLITY